MKIYLYNNNRPITLTGQLHLAGWASCCSMSYIWQIYLLIALFIDWFIYIFEHISSTVLLPGRTGRSTLPALHPGRWQTSLRTGSHFWLFLPRDLSCLRSGRQLCPSGASHRDPEHTCAGKRRGGSQLCIPLNWLVCICWLYLQLSGVESLIDFTGFWHVALKVSSISLQWGISWTHNHSRTDWVGYEMTVKKKVFHFRFWGFFVCLWCSVDWPLEGDSGLFIEL